MPHLVPHIPVGGHSEEIPSSACTEIALEWEIGYREIPGELRGHLIPVLHSPVHTSGNNYIGELKIVEKLVLLAGSIVNLHAHFSYCKRSEAAGTLACKGVLDFNAALEDVSENTFLIPALELSIVKPLVAVSLLGPQRELNTTVTNMLTIDSKNITTMLLCKTCQFYIISRI